MGNYILDRQKILLLLLHSNVRKNRLSIKNWRKNKHANFWFNEMKDFAMKSFVGVHSNDFIWQEMACIGLYWFFSYVIYMNESQAN